MKKLLIPALAILLALTILGCGNRESKQTAAVQVKNPPEKSSPSAGSPMGMPPSVKPAAPAKPAPVGKDGWVTLPSGLKYKDKKVGTGKEVKSQTHVTVQYKGWLDNGTVFDTSRKPGRTPFEFTVDNDQVIQGWHQGVKEMKVGGIRELTIPPVLGYGSDDMGQIPPNSTLHFEIELLKAD